MAFSKIRLNGTVLMDVTSTTAVEADVNYPKLFTKADGVQASGTNTGDTPVVFIQDENGYIILDEGAIVQPEAGWNDVCFWDYDGKCLYSYSASEFAELTEMPNNPMHEGLVSEGWNWSLTDAKEHVSTYGFLDIGQLYVTKDGKTRLHIHVGSLDRPTRFLNLTCTSIGALTIDWGDGSPTETNTGSTVTLYTHTYEDVGDYCIVLSNSSGTLKLGDGYDLMGDRTNNSYWSLSSLYAVELGEDVYIGNNGIRNHYSLATMTFSRSTTYSASQSIFPNTGIVSLILPAPYGSAGKAYITDYKGVAICMAKQTEFQGEFSALRSNSLKRFCIPVNTMGNQLFSNAPSLEYFVFSDNATSTKTQMLNDARSLIKVTIPATMSEVSNNSFINTFSIKELHMEATIPPSMTGANNFTSCPSDFVIYVPYSADHSVLTAYQTATNWSTFAARMQEESQGGA